MKFAKVLQDEVVPEWRKAYINYKLGKKYLKKIEAAVADYETAQDQRPTDHHSCSESAAGTRPLRVTIDPSTPDNLGRTLTSEPENDYPERPAAVHSPDLAPDSPTGTTPIIGQGRPCVKSYDTIQSAKFPQGPSTTLNIPDEDRSERSSTLQGAQGVLQQQQQQQQQPQQSQSQSVNIKPTERGRPVVEGDTIDSVMVQLLPEEVEFFEFLDGELKMVDVFYREKELEAVTKLKVLKQQLYVADEWKRLYDETVAKAQEERGWYQAEWSKVKHGIGNLMGEDSSVQEDVTLGPANHANHTVTDALSQKPNRYSIAASNSATGSNTFPGQEIRQREGRGPVEDGRDMGRPPFDKAAFQNQWVLEDAEHRRQHLNHKVARTRIKAALYEFYRSLEMLRNYKVSWTEQTHAGHGD
ncbi:SPX domain-containing protein [Dissophora ornata]|nr:SPX domain-containing protein [Dissophora ornata]